MEIIIIDDQVSMKLENKIIGKLVKLILKKENIITDEVILNFVNEQKIKELHLKYFNDPTLTDCISFPIDSPNEKVNHHVLGEVFICPATALKYAKTHKKDPKSELALYIIHTILHLIGYDDIKENDIKIMREKEKQYLSLYEKYNIKKLG
ncbi:MAG: rRNA maturation RNase YbeY [Parachlamydiales bacterium]|jgi:probable rRNA maturation factor